MIARKKGREAEKKEGRVSYTWKSTVPSFSEGKKNKGRKYDPIYLTSRLYFLLFCCSTEQQHLRSSAVEVDEDEELKGIVYLSPPFSLSLDPF